MCGKLSPFAGVGNGSRATSKTNRGGFRARGRGLNFSAQRHTTHSSIACSSRLLTPRPRARKPRFIVPKEQERAEVLVKNAPAGFKFKKGESYVFSYSFRARDNMRVSGSSTRFGQIKGVNDGKQVSGTPLLAVTATNDGLHVRLSNDGAGYIRAMEESLSWEDSAGEWVHVEVKTTFGKSMEVGRN